MEDIGQSKALWKIQEEQQVFRLHLQYGNKWSAIAVHLPGRTENCIKNKFYSTLRRGLRKINKYISKVRRRTHKEDLSNNKIIQQQFLTKLSAIADGNFSQRYEAKPRAVEASQDIKQRLITLAHRSYEYAPCSKETYQFQQDLLHAILQFKKHCKKRKGNKKLKLKNDSVRPQTDLLDHSSGQQGASSQSSLVVRKTANQQSVVGDPARNAQTQIKIQQQIFAQRSLQMNPSEGGFEPPNPDEQNPPYANFEALTRNPGMSQSSLQGIYNSFSLSPFPYVNNNYSFVQMVDTSAHNSYPTYPQFFFPQLMSIDTSRTLSASTELINSQQLDQRMFLMQAMPMMLPKQQELMLRDELNRERESVEVKDEEPQAQVLQPASKVYKSAVEDNINNPRLRNGKYIKRRSLRQKSQGAQCKREEEYSLAPLHQK